MLQNQAVFSTNWYKHNVTKEYNTTEIIKKQKLAQA